MALFLPRGWWGYHWSPPHPRSVVELIRAGTLDAELAATIWLLVEARVPVVVVAGPPLAGKSTLLTALLDFVAPQVPLHVLRGRGETFDWLPQALEWLVDVEMPHLRRVNPEPAESPGYLLAAEFSDHLPIYTWGRQARLAVKAIGLGYGLATTAHAESPAELLEQLRRPPVSLSDPEVRQIGVVLVLRMLSRDGTTLDPTGRDRETLPFEAGVVRRVVAAHYVRALPSPGEDPVPTIATWDAAVDRFVHRSEPLPEMAARVGRTTLAFAAEREARARYLVELAAAGVVDIEPVRLAIDAYGASPDVSLDLADASIGAPATAPTIRVPLPAVRPDEPPQPLPPDRSGPWSLPDTIPDPQTEPFPE